MKADIHFSSRMLTLSGGLMTASGILMAVRGRLAIGGIFWAAASWPTSSPLSSSRGARRAMISKHSERTTQGKMVKSYGV